MKKIKKFRKDEELNDRKSEKKPIGKKKRAVLKPIHQKKRPMYHYLEEE
jgi:hypothetical protein